ncbi:MAG: DUF354 domain-containing protein [Candidatus Omnitrophica bacterium]|nr:DUF354 domain-containing protein [Candidatus Omnitrophota bacterium]
MNILFDINHPAHVHYFRNAIGLLQKQGHQIFVTARDKDVTLQLLDSFNLKHQNLSTAQNGLWKLGFELVKREAQIFSILLRKKISICVSSTGACSVHACKLLGIPSLVFYDTEDATLQNALTIPFATQYITPESYFKRMGKNHTTYNGVQELAYLHPKYFSPDPSIYDLLQIAPDEKYIVIRFVAWGAAHDIGKKSLSEAAKQRLVKSLSRMARVIILSESALSPELEPYKFSAPPERAHDLLNYASLYIGESATMASESACLGTPAIYVSPRKLGYVKEGEKYELIFDLDKEEDILNKSKEILSMADDLFWKKKREAFLNAHIDVTDFFVKTIIKFGLKKGRSNVLA